jgi:1-acyl-sn-glycerol-3-phosphate acyltransferase
MLLYARSALFNALYYLNLIVWMIGVLPTLVMPRQAFMTVARIWAGTSLWLLRVVCGTRFELRGAGNIPPGGFLVASKHQSLWETFALLTVFKDPAFVLKRELRWIPFFGWYTWKAQSIPVNRGGGGKALADMNRRAAEAARGGRQIVIFPEGTRRAPGAPAAYKYGIAHMYEQMGLPCVPVALNSGVFWPRRKLIRRPGTIVIEVLPVIPPGLPRDMFFSQMQDAIEAASARLLAEATGQSGSRG